MSRIMSAPISFRPTVIPAWTSSWDQFDKYNAFIRKQEIEKELKQIRTERAAAAACGYDFVVGVSTQAHKDALLEKVPTLHVVVTGCPR